ncbi:BglG family transcription antiterminator [Bacillus cereus]|uniref:BglG family transcription antiterminator n=1 Tax=Bacillus cereus TaxID=1396 RepID=UPI0018F45E25|nr:helix-turn-helix domain-containing protein [Bacillus cereus]MBJ8025830.1 helix-turn-helix domain-containing protein [Bacillus cereus]MBJ8038138.1 helix-turn-helix domain-containing protein [Bacillus cereus]
MFTYQRQLEIISILLQDHKWHTLEEIANQVHCAVKTVRKDLHYLKDELPMDWEIRLIKGKGIKLYKPPHSSQIIMYSFFKQKDMKFRVLNQLFYGQVHTVKQLADSLFVQVAALSPVLRSVQSHLHSFDLDLLKRPLRIEGIEAHIVYMFYELYFDTYGWGEWPFSEKEEIFSYIKQIERAVGIQFYPSYIQRLAFILAVAIHRKKQGYEMKISSIHAKMIKETPFYNKIKELPSVLCNILLTTADLIFLTIAVNCCMFVYSSQDQFKQEVLQHFYEGTSTVYQYAQDLVEQLEKEFDIHFRQDKELLFCLLQCIRRSFYRDQFILTHALPSSDWHEQIKQKHTTTFQKVSSVYTAWVQKHPFLYKVHEEDAVAITVQLEATFQLAQSYRKRLLLYLEDYTLWKRYIEGVLYREFGNMLFIISEDVLNINNECDLLSLDIDGIVSVVPLENMELPILQISVVPTHRELEDIKVFLNSK